MKTKLQRYEHGPTSIASLLAQEAHAQEWVRRKLQAAREQGHEVIGDTVIIKGVERCKTQS